MTYNWTVSAGTIESGQGTPSITVATTGEMAGSNVTATVNIGGQDDAAIVRRKLRKPAASLRTPQAVLVDEFGKQTHDEIRARLDTFFAELPNNPNNQGYIINYGTDREIAEREKLDHEPHQSP